MSSFLLGLILAWSWQILNPFCVFGVVELAQWIFHGWLFTFSTTTLSYLVRQWVLCSWVSLCRMKCFSQPRLQSPLLLASPFLPCFAKAGLGGAIGDTGKNPDITAGEMYASYSVTCSKWAFGVGWSTESESTWELGMALWMCHLLPGHVPYRVFATLTDLQCLGEHFFNGISKKSTLLQR